MSKVRRFVRMFQVRFAPLVECGEKCRTIRSIPARMPEPGDVIDCRCWEGAPYRSKQRKLREAVLSQVRPVRIEKERIIMDGYMVIGMAAGLDAFARADGFGDWTEMVEWFDQTHGLPFTGVLLMWDPPFKAGGQEGGRVE